MFNDLLCFTVKWPVAAFDDDLERVDMEVARHEQINELGKSGQDMVFSPRLEQRAPTQRIALVGESVQVARVRVSF